MATRNIPSDYTLIHKDDEANFEINGDLEKLTACLHSGRRKNPDWHYRFNSVEKMNDYISKEIEYHEKMHADRVQREEEMKRKAEEEAAKVQVGDIYVYSWGWEQTNVNFYQVIEKPSPKTIVIREIGCESIEEASWASDYVKPVKDMFLNEETERVRINKYGGFKRSCGTAVSTEGKEKHYRSWYA